MKPVVVCTEYRGVFFGYAEETSGDVIHLTDAQMCVYWDQATRGVVGLAATGPTKGCRVTKPAPAMELRKVTCVMDVTDDAVAAWKSAPWS